MGVVVLEVYAGISSFLGDVLGSRIVKNPKRMKLLGSLEVPFLALLFLPRELLRPSLRTSFWPALILLLS